MLGIIGAMDAEINAIKKNIENKTVTAFAGVDFVCGTLAGREVCAAQCSPGKVNAALCTQIMIDRFAPDAVINVGVGCSLSKEVKIKNVVAATEVCQYDFDTSAIDGARGLVLGDSVKIPTDTALTQALVAAATAAGITVRTGCIATGDTFIASQALKDDIAGAFGAVCGEMEGGAIGQVCFINGVPFAVVRAISDGGDESAQMDYPAFKEVAAAMTQKILLDFLSKQ